MVEKLKLREIDFNKIESLMSYDMSFVFERLKIEGKINMDIEIQELEAEFKKFISLVCFGVSPLAMISPKIDEVWHQFILFTKEYEKFCEETVGFHVHHTPDIPSNPVPVIAGQNFMDEYRNIFGDIPKVWFDGMDEETKKYYGRSVLTGKPPKAWSGWVGDD